MSWSMERLMGLATGYWASSALSAAVQLGLFDAIDAVDGGASAASAAGSLGTSQRHTEALLDALCGLQLVDKTAPRGGSESRYRIHPGAAALLSRKSPHCTLDALRYNVDLYPLWGQLADVVRQGAPRLPGAHLGGDAERTRRFVLGMEGRARPMIPAVVPALRLDGRTKLLDVAAGPGAFSGALADAQPDLQLTLFDLPPILEVTRSLCSARASASRTRFHPGDYHVDPLPRGFDAVLYSGALHQEDPQSARALMQGIFASLLPGGKVYVVDMMSDASRTAPVFSTLFSLNMMLTSPTGRVFSDAELMQQLGEVGFVNAQRSVIERSPYWLVTADKPG